MLKKNKEKTKKNSWQIWVINDPILYSELGIYFRDRPPMYFHDTVNRKKISVGIYDL